MDNERGCIYIEEGEEINDLEMGDVIKLPMKVMGLDIRKDDEGKEIKSYKFEYTDEDETEDEEKSSGDSEVKKIMKGVVSKAMQPQSTMLEPLPSKQTPTITSGTVKS